MKFPVIALAALALSTVPGAAAANTIAHLKGHTATAAPQARQAAAPRVCHPEPTKGRDCRHRIAQRETVAGEVFASADAASVSPRVQAD